MSIDQLGIHLGPLYLRFYALCILAGILAAAALIAYRARRQGQDPVYLWDGLVWVVLAGIAGARIYHVLTPPPSMGITAWEYLQRPWRVIAIWEGGLGIPGAIIGGGLALLVYTRRQGLDFWLWADLAVPGVALGQAIGRWGNYFNQELYGQPTDLPWAVTIRPGNRIPGYEAYSRFHPTFLYEIILNLAICAGLMWVERRFPQHKRPGDLLALYTMAYSTGRFFLEFLKLDAPALSEGLTIAQLVSLAAFVAGAGLLMWRHRRPAESHPAR